MREPKRILVTQSHFKHSLAIIRALARQGHRVYGLVNAADRHPPARYSRYCAGTFCVNQEEEERFLAEIRPVLKEQRIDVLVPVGFPVTHFVAKHASALRDAAHFAVPTIDSEELATDKYASGELAAKIGVPTPRTIRVTSPNRLEESAASLGSPLIIKGCRETGRGIVAKVEDSAHVAKVFREQLERFGLSRPEDYPLLQEFIPGWGCGFFAIYDRGVCKRVFMHKRIREFPPSGGASCCAQSFSDERLEEYGRRLLDALGWHGVAMVEFRYDTRVHDYKLIEVNAKFWGSLELALAAGADFAGDYLKIALGEEIPFHRGYRQITYQWFLGGDLQHALRSPRAIIPVIGTLLNPLVKKDILGWDDPGLLALRMAVLGRQTLRQAWKRLFCRQEHLVKPGSE